MASGYGCMDGGPSDDMLRILYYNVSFKDVETKPETDDKSDYE